MILKGKIALVTAAGSGIGRAGAIAMAREGAIVIATDRDLEGAAQTATMANAAGGQAQAHGLDVSDDSAIAALVDTIHGTYGRIDILHNHAGVQVAGSLEEVSVDQFDQSWTINVRAQFVACQAVLPVMKAQGGGVILNTASNAGIFLDKGMLAYITTKSAVITMTKQIALDYARAGIRANALCPGWIDTPFNAPYTKQLGGRGALETVVEQQVPLGRFGTHEEIADAIIFLVSKRSAYITGHALVVDGGESLAGGANAFS